MLNGSYLRLPGSSEGWTAQEPWLLPISDGGDAPSASANDTVAEAVRSATRPLFLAANGLCLALALLLAAETATGWMGGRHAPIAKAPVITASAS